MNRPWRDRSEAGRQVALRLSAYVGRPDVVALALPRGGVPAACAVARAWGTPLDVVPVHTLAVPGYAELAMGAIAAGGVRVLKAAVVRGLDRAPDTIDAVAARGGEELARRERAYRADRPPPEVAGRTIILVDVAAPATCEALRAEVDDIVCALTPEPFDAVGLWDADFAPSTDVEVHALLEWARSRAASDTEARTPGETTDGGT